MIIIAKILLYVILTVYTNWRIHITNEVFFKENPDWNYRDSYLERCGKFIGAIFSSFYLLIVFFQFGFSIFNYKRSIFTGEIIIK